jgi:hypothetical protein
MWNYGLFIVGAPSHSGGGAAYIFVSNHLYNGNDNLFSYKEQSKIVSSRNSLNFGFAVEIESYPTSSIGVVAVLSNPGNASSNQFDELEIFSNNTAGNIVSGNGQNGWTFVESHNLDSVISFTPPKESLALSGDVIAVGVPTANGGAGEVLIFRSDPTILAGSNTGHSPTFDNTKTVVAPFGNFTEFGLRVALSNGEGQLLVTTTTTAFLFRTPGISACEPSTQPVIGGETHLASTSSAASVVATLCFTTVLALFALL